MGWPHYRTGYLIATASSSAVVLGRCCVAIGRLRQAVDLGALLDTASKFVIIIIGPEVGLQSSTSRLPSKLFSFRCSFLFFFLVGVSALLQSLLNLLSDPIVYVSLSGFYKAVDAHSMWRTTTDPRQIPPYSWQTASLNNGLAASSPCSCRPDSDCCFWVEH